MKEQAEITEEEGQGRMDRSSLYERMIECINGWEDNARK